MTKYKMVIDRERSRTYILHAVINSGINPERVTPVYYGGGRYVIPAGAGYVGIEDLKAAGVTISYFQFYKPVHKKPF